MNKEINELDRMIVGVREWAVQETAEGLGFVEVDSLLECAKKLEEYVLRGIKD